MKKASGSQECHRDPQLTLMCKSPRREHGTNRPGDRRAPIAASFASSPTPRLAQEAVGGRDTRSYMVVVSDAFRLLDRIALRMFILTSGLVPATGRGQLCRNRAVSHEQISAGTPNAVTAGSGPGDAQRRNNGIAHIRHRRPYLRASTKLHGQNGASHLFTAGASTEGRRYRCVRDAPADHVKMVA